MHQEYVAPLTIDDYLELTEVEHILKSSDMWIGSTRKLKSTTWSLDDRATMVTTTMPEGMCNTFREILSNACDNVDRSLRARVDPGIIEVTVCKKSISVRNGGLPIIVQKFKGSDLYLPEILMSRLRAGSSFGEVRTGAGRNGMGAALVNTVSNYFEVSILDATTHKSYTQLWSNTDYNRKFLSAGKPEIGNYEGKLSSTTVSYQLEFKRFGYKDGYPAESTGIFKRLAAEASLSCKVIVEFNRQVLDYRSIIDYAAMFYPDRDFKYIVYYIWPKGTEVTHNKDGTQSSRCNRVLPIVETMIIDRSSPKVSISLCNSVSNDKGGAYVTPIYEALLSTFATITDKKVQKGKGTDSTSLCQSDVKGALSLITNVRLHNVEWMMQTKKSVTSHSVNKKGEEGTFKVHFSESDVAAFKQWEAVKKIEESMLRKRVTILKKTDAKKDDVMKTKKGKICEWAGTDKWLQTILIIFEGDSSMQYADIIRKCHENGFNVISLLPTGGKIKNVRGCTPEDLVKNTFFVDFKSMMGICEGVDYSKPSGFNTLKHGSIWIMTDADVDGKHIKGLLLNLIATQYPSLLSIRGFIKEFKTKLVTAKKGKESLKFFNEHEMHVWKTMTHDWEKWELTHYKGLGTSTKEEAVDDWKDQYIIDIVTDSASLAYLDMAFNHSEECMKKKKMLIDNYNKSVNKPYTHVPRGGVQYITDFVREELVTYMVADIVRHLPRRDGFAPSNRKIIHVATSTWSWWESAKKERLVAFAYEVMKKTDYHHGDLSGVVIKMTQDFVGSNNLPYFNPLGMYGSRGEGGKDHAAPRYPFVSTNNIWKHVFKKRDADLLDYLPAEKTGTIEPEMYYPTIPHFLINGVDALMSGYRSFIPKYNPLDVTTWLKDKIRRRVTKSLTPWYRGFRGTVDVVDKRELERVTEECVEEKVIDEMGERRVKNVVRCTAEMKGRYFMMTKGLVELVGEDGGIVTELPIGVWTQSYLNILEKMKKKGVIKGYKDISTLDKDIRIKVWGFKTKPSVADFKVTKCVSMSMMLILGDDDSPIHFNSVEEILQDYFRWRYPLYVKRRLLDIEKAEKKVNDACSKIMFVRAVMSGKLMTKKRDERDVLVDIEALGLDRSIYMRDKINERTYCNEGLDALYRKRDALIETKEQLERVEPEEIWLRDIEGFEASYLDAKHSSRRDVV